MSYSKNSEQVVAVIVLPVPMTEYQIPGAVIEVPQNGNVSSIVALFVNPTTKPGTVIAMASSHRSFTSGVQTAQRSAGL